MTSIFGIMEDDLDWRRNKKKGNESQPQLLLNRKRHSLNVLNLKSN